MRHKLTPRVGVTTAAEDTATLSRWAGTIRSGLAIPIVYACRFGLVLAKISPTRDRSARTLPLGV